MSDDYWRRDERAYEERGRSRSRSRSRGRRIHATGTIELAVNDDRSRNRPKGNKKEEKKKVANTKL